MALMGFKDLPYAVIFEICNYLDVETLISLADLNKDTRNLSRSYKSYWLSCVLREGLILPLPRLRPLASFSPPELSIATRRAIFRERNLSLERPKLYSSTRIPWPSWRSGTSVEGGPLLGNDLKNQRPLDVSWIPAFHSNGEWYFALSKDFVLRVLHLRTATLVLEEALYESKGEDYFVPAAYAIDTLDEYHARVAVVTPEDPSGITSSQSPNCCVLSTHAITLNPKLVTASRKLIAQTSLTLVPKLFDLSGDYAVLVEDDEAWPECGTVHLVNWETGSEVDLPPLLRSFGVAGFPDYFLSLGIDSQENIELQVVSLPLSNRSPQSINKDLAEHGREASEDSGFILAASIPLRSDSKDIYLDASSYWSIICHQYTGLTVNKIRIWIRDDCFESCYSVFDVSVDFSKHPREWFTSDSMLLKETAGAEIPLYDVEHRRLSEKDNVLCLAVPGTSGTRFFWWREDFAPAKEPGTPADDSLRTIFLYSSDTSTLVPLQHRKPEAEKEDGEAQTPEAADSDFPEIMRRYEDCLAYPTREMECPFICHVPMPPPPRREDESEASDDGDEDDDECVYSVVVEDWSGTVLITLRCGDLIVLRYGHP